MAECEICGDNVDDLCTCSSCGVKFCENCGNISQELCNECKKEDEGPEREAEKDIAHDVSEFEQEQD